MNLTPHSPALVVATDGFWNAGTTNGLRAETARNAMLHHETLECYETDPSLKIEVA